MSTKYLDMQLRTSPHLKRDVSVEIIMRNVVYALVPVVLVAVYTFGLSALLVILTTLIFCVMTEAVVGWLTKRKQTLHDFSVVITGILLGLTLPPGFPLWMAALGAIVSVLLGKILFGGLGFNVFNPALVGRAFLQAAFPVAITTWAAEMVPNRFTSLISTTLTLPLMRPETADALSGATPLAALKFDQQTTAVGDLLFGNIAGSVGETCAIIILLGGIYLAARKMLDWRIPVGILLTVAVVSWVLHLANPSYPTPWFMLFSGGLMLGAVFMATDMVTSPVTPLGVWLYGILIGILIVAIRIWGGLPEGVMYAILIGNAVSPSLNRITQPRVYGTQSSKKAKEAAS